MMKKKSSTVLSIVRGTGKALALFSTMFATACSSTGDWNSLFPPAGDNSIKIESAPSGAEVYVMGEKVGVTPLNIRHQDVFPTVYPKEKESVYGRVTLKKAGCADFTRTVSSAISSVGLRAQLDCREMDPASAKTSGGASPISETAEQRLEKIKDLLDKGLITEDEAKTARARVINDL